MTQCELREGLYRRLGRRDFYLDLVRIKSERVGRKLFLKLMMRGTGEWADCA
ncbi:hypothetical protein D3C72_2261430 [compost metagenome]